MAGAKENTYDYICFSDLAYEFNSSEQKKIESKIKRRLKYHKLGTYDQEHVNYIRDLKNDLLNEISAQDKSKYYQKSSSEYSDSKDFDLAKMKSDYSAKYDKVNSDEIADMITFAIYLYHLR
jgi:hypothetical protein